MDSPRRDPAAGLFGSLGRLLGTVLEMAQVRLDLLSAEIQREKLRVFDGLVWAAVALLFIGLGLLLLAALLVLLAPEPLRLWLLALLALASLGAGAWLVRQAARRLNTPAGSLAATRQELALDRANLNPPD
jgi:uncharacterized membrane protein YqjE